MLEPSTALDRDYDGEPTSLRATRRDVLAWLSARGAGEETKQKAALIVSELATNALQASPGHTYHVSVVMTDDHCAEIAVRNHTTGGLPPDRDRWTFAEPSSLRGRGLAIVSSLSEDVVVSSGNDDVVVTARIQL